MEISPRKPSKRAQEPADEWLQNEGYFRKHAPRDPTCLFRAVSEQVYLTQHYHIRVRKECVEFMRKMRHIFEQFVTISFDNYLEQMACFTEWGGINEIQAMSLLYKKEFVIFNGQKQIRKTVTNNGFKESVYLCYTPQKQYESVYTRDFIANAAFCQSIVYQILYKDVFNMSNIESTVHKMLHDRTTTFRHDKFFLKGNLEIREQLAAEIYNKIETGTDETDDTQTSGKTTPPIPYRVAKALDPHIYRNTDFDIWHEIRREVKNAGWTRHNTHELQIGGKCLVQMDFCELDTDKINNNILMCTSETDSNGNNVKTFQKKAKPDAIFFCGHIQEMTKNQGPVVVFIEELGEKRSVPYSALKPLPLRKNRQGNWSPICKRNTFLDANQRWKKSGSINSRKIKDSVATILSNNIDKNGNNNSTIETNKNNCSVSHWSEDSLTDENPQMFDNYSTEKYSTHSHDSSTTMYTTENILDNTQSSAQQGLNKDEKTKTSSFTNHVSNENILNKAPQSETNCNSNMQFNSPPKQKPEKNTYHSAYNGNSQIVPDSTNSFCTGSHGNSQPVLPCASGNMGESDTENQMDRMLRFINCSAEKSIDANGSDLPLSDPMTLRFFYNLGLEYFRVTHTWNYATNGNATNFGVWYQEGASPNINGLTTATNGVIKNCSAMQKGEQVNVQKDSDKQSVPQEMPTKCTNGIKDTKTYSSGSQRTDTTKELIYSSRDKTKEQGANNKDVQRINRNGIAPRFKKNSEIRHRNNYQDQSQTVHNFNKYQHRGSNSNSGKAPDNKVENINSQCLNSAPQTVHASAGAPNSCHTPYVQQGVYAGLPYYLSEAEAFGNPYYVPNPGFFQFPYMPQSDMLDNNNVPPFSPHMCPGVDFTPAYPGLCSPYICPQPTPYNIPPQNMQEHWYPVPGQSPFIQYAPMVPIPTEADCNIAGQNNTQNTSS